MQYYTLAWTEGFFDRSCWQSQPQSHLQSRLLISVGSHRCLSGFVDRWDSQWSCLGRTWWLPHASSCLSCAGPQMVSAPLGGITAQAQQLIRKLWCRNKSKLWSFLSRSFHCTPGNKHVTFSSGKLHTALGFVQHRRLDVVGLGFMPGRADTWRQMLYSYREFMEILSHHIGLCDKTKQDNTLISYLYFSVFLEESLCFLKAEIKVTVSS